MTDYRRMHIEGACYFFTVNCTGRRGHGVLIQHIDLLRQTFRHIRAAHPFHIDAMVVLPDHLHCIWTLPPGDQDYKTRWALIKAGFSRQLPAVEPRSTSRQQRGERGLWQRRYWEHLIRDERDYRNHMDYIHMNPVKHGWVNQVTDWPYSSFHRYVDKNIYPQNWDGDISTRLDVGERC